MFNGLSMTFNPVLAALMSARIVPSFDPLTLFAAGEPGVWYDPSDFSTLFQDAAGTTPVTAVGQPVGLMLDKSKGLVLGPELVTNGDFSDGLAGWSQTGTSWSPVGGTAKNDGTAGLLYKQAIVTVGAWVVVECTIADKGTAGSLSISLSDGGATASFSSASLVNGQRVSVRGVKTVNGSVYFFGQGGWNGAITNISIRELPGNHASQTTATSRPVLSARYNLLTKTEQFDDAAWAKYADGTAITTVTSNVGVDPHGALTADLVTFVAGGNNLITHNVTVPPGVSMTLSVWMRGTIGGEKIRLDLRNTFSDGVSGQQFTLTTEWVRYSVTVNNYSGISRGFQLRRSSSEAGTSSFYIWGADLRVANDGANLPPYQRVNTATDYDTAGFPHYLRFDGVDDWLVTNTITPGTDKVQVFAGVRKLSDAAIGILAELSANLGSNDGTFYVGTPSSVTSSGQDAFVNKGTGGVAGICSSTTSSPATMALTGLANMGGNSATMRKNGAVVSFSGADQGTGNYLAYPLYIGRRGSATLPFNGHLYSLIVRFGNNLPIETIEKTEKYINQKTRAY